ncbi:MAG: helix-turn-helix domain-containing protein [Bacteroidota bacterium]
MPRRKAAAEFAQDLKAIREKHAVALHEVQDRTKVPLDVLERFETNLLIDNQHHNRVYIRALVRSYVAVLKLDEEQTLDALDTVLEGEYNRELAVAHLGLKKPKVDPSPPKPKSAPPSAAAPPPVAKPVPLPPKPSATVPPRPDVLRETARSSQDTTGGPSPFASLGPAVGAGVLVLALAAAVAFWAVTREGPEASMPPDAQEEAERAVEEAPPPPPTPASVGETIDVRIVAQPGPVLGVRLTADADLRRPYWIEPDSVRAVSVQERLVIEDQWERFRLEVEGYDYPTSERVRDAQNRLVLTKPVVQAFLDSVSVR